MSINIFGQIEIVGKYLITRNIRLAAFTGA